MKNKTRYTVPYARALTRILADFGGRRKLFDRRLPPNAGTIKERRSGGDRRSGFDRRSTAADGKAEELDRRRDLSIETQSNTYPSEQQHDPPSGLVAIVYPALRKDM